MKPGTRVLVTGAAGFIGSHLVERLLALGCRVRAFVHYNGGGYRHNLELLSREAQRAIEEVSGDLTDPYAVDAAIAGQEVVFHLAALIAIPYSYRAPAAYVATNVMGTLNVLEACRRHGVQRLVHTSTSEVYGTAQYVPIDEQHPQVAQSPYAASKIAADKLVESFQRSFDVSAVIVRPFNTFGPRQSGRAVIPTIISQALSGEAIRLGSVAPVRDFTFVTDTAAGFVAAARSNAVVGQVVQLGTGVGVSVGDVARLVLQRVGRDLPIVEDPSRVRPAQSEVERLIASNSRAQSLTGWRPEVDLATGLDRTIAFIREHPQRFRPEVYHV